MNAIINAKAVLPGGVVDNATILHENGRIVAAGRDVEVPAGARVLDAKGMWVGPGFVDIHVHGDGGACCWEDDPEKVAPHHLRHGSTTVVATMTYWFSPADLLERTKNVQAKIAAGLLPNVYAVSLEGPFINPTRGANSDANPRPRPDPAEYLPLYEATHGKIAQWMYAPEMDEDGSFGDFLREKNIPAAVGHTNASPAQVRAAVDRGATITTHLFDAMGCCHGNDSWKYTGTIQESVAASCLVCPELTYEIIPDSRGVHVKPTDMRLAYIVGGPDRVAIITDSTTCNYDPADYPADDLRSTVDLNYNERGQLCGSRLTMDLACANFIKHTGVSVSAAFRMAATTPARAIGADKEVGSIVPGKWANFVLLDEELKLQQVIFRGDVVQR